MCFYLQDPSTATTESDSEGPRTRPFSCEQVVEAVSVEWAEKCLSIFFKCPCGKGLLSEKNCYYRLVLFAKNNCYYKLVLISSSSRMTSSHHCLISFKRSFILLSLCASTKTI